MVRVHVKLRKIKFLTDPFSKYAIWDFHSKCNFSTDFDPIFIYLYIESVLIGSRFHFSFDSCRSYIASRYTHTSFHTLFFLTEKFVFSCVCGNFCYEYVVRAGFRSLHTRISDGRRFMCESNSPSAASAAIVVTNMLCVLVSGHYILDSVKAFMCASGVPCWRTGELLSHTKRLQRVEYVSTWNQHAPHTRNNNCRRRSRRRIFRLKKRVWMEVCV